MDIPQEDLQPLIELGLTLVQAKILLTLTQTGKTNVRTISQVSKVARPDVYRSLSKLQAIGLIEKEIVNPVLYMAIPTKDAIKILLERQTRKQKELKVQTSSLITKYKSQCSTFWEESTFVYVPSKEALIKKLKKAIDGTKESIDASTSCKRFQYACYIFGSKLKNAWNRGVKGRVIINSTEKNQLEFIKECWKAPLADVRYISKVPRTVMVMYDKKEVFIFVKPNADLKESPALWSNDPSLLAMVKDYFEILWKTAMQIPEYNLNNIQT